MFQITDVSECRCETRAGEFFPNGTKWRGEKNGDKKSQVIQVYKKFDT